MENEEKDKAKIEDGSTKETISRRKAIQRIATALAAVAAGSTMARAKSFGPTYADVGYKLYSEIYIDYSRYKEVYGDYSSYHSIYVPPPPHST